MAATRREAFSPLGHSAGGVGMARAEDPQPVRWVLVIRTHASCIRDEPLGRKCYYEKTHLELYGSLES